MSDKISQEEIDKLLRESAAGAAAESSPEAAVESPKYEFITSEEADTLGEVCNIFMGSASTTLSMLLGTKVDITTPVVCEYKLIEESLVANDDRVITEIEYIEGLTGATVFALKSIDTSIIADLMMGGEGKATPDKEIGELELSAVGEAMNQMVGSASTSLASMFNFPINISHPSVKIKLAKEKFQLNTELLECPVIAVKFRLLIGTLIDSEIVQIMSAKSAKQQVKHLLGEVTHMSEELAKNTGNIESIAENIINAQQAQQTVVAAPPPPSIPQHQTPPMQPAAPPPMPQNYPPPPPGYHPPYPQYGYPSPMPQQQVTVQPVEFASFDNNQNIYGEVNQNLNLVMDVKLELTVELGRTVLPIKNVLEFTRGSIIELDKVAGEPVELFANGKLIAKGEVVVIEDNFGLRIISIVSPENRIKDL